MNQCPVHFIQHGKLVRKQSRKLRVRAQHICLAYQCVFRIMFKGAFQSRFAISAAVVGYPHCPVLISLEV